jgi:serine/threonine protein phosphatase PrpC
VNDSPPDQGAGGDQDDTVTIILPTAGGPAMRWDVAGKSDTGKIRRINEDSFLVHPRAPLWLVADGMGGHAKGDLASSSIAHAFAQLDLPDRLSDAVDLAEATLLELNARLRELADYGRDGVTIGSTVVILIAHRAYVLMMWVGDSRIYRSRRGQLEQLTQDHSQVEEMISQGLLRREDAESHPAANVVTRAVGAADEIFVDMDYRVVEPEDTFLLCSDGLTKEVPESDIAAILAQPCDAETLCGQLLARTLAHGARDNVTVVIARALAAQGAK